MKCFVTGATGFVGSHVVRMLVESRIPTAVLVRNNASCRKLVHLLSDVQVFCGDMHDESVLSAALQCFRPDTILHLGWTGVAAGNRNETLQLCNLQTSIKLVQLAKNLGVSTIVALGSQAEYGPKEIAMDEHAACAPNTLYGAAKLASSTIGIQLCKLNNIRFVWLRLFSCFGPGDHSGAMIPSLIATLLAGEKPSLTSARQKWDYLYVDDAAKAVIHSAVNSNLEGIFNLGSGNAVELRQIIECIRDQIDSSLPLGFGEIAQNQDAPKHLEANIGKLVASGWKPETSLLEGIKTTIDWVKKEVSQ